MFCPNCGQQIKLISSMTSHPTEPTAYASRRYFCAACMLNFIVGSSSNWADQSMLIEVSPAEVKHVRFI